MWGIPKQASSPAVVVPAYRPYPAQFSAACAAHEGHEVNSQGDSFIMVFPRATQAVAATVAMQYALAAAAWPEGGAVRVRIGLHTGEPMRTAAGYTGLDVIRGARIRDDGHGGQVLLSKSTAALVEDALLDGLSLRDLGAYRLKNLPRPERILQLIIPDLPADFPPLPSLDTPRHAPGRVLTTMLCVAIPRAVRRMWRLGSRKRICSSCSGSRSQWWMMKRDAAPVVVRKSVETEHERGGSDEDHCGKMALGAVCFSVVGAIGGGLYGHLVLTPLCSHTSEWRSFSDVQSRYHLA